MTYVTATLSAILIFTACVADADTATQSEEGVQEPTVIELCTQYSSTAETVMEARQTGVPMHQSMKVAEGSSAMVQMVEDAYGRSRYNSEKYRQEIITEFGNAWFSSCMQSLSKEAS